MKYISFIQATALVLSGKLPSLIPIMKIWKLRRKASNTFYLYRYISLSSLFNNNR
jgi:hypothetical protein